MQTLSFRISGEFITNIAREKFYQNNDLKSALELLKNCLKSDQLTENQTLMLALQILNYDAEITGIYPDDNYGVKFNKDHDENSCDMSRIIEMFDNISKRNKNAHDIYAELLKKYLFVCNQLSDSKLIDINAEYYNENDEFLFPDIDVPAWKLAKNNNNNKINNPMLESFLEQRKREISGKNTHDDYGWLDPEGNFHPVEWCRHDEWARNYLDENKPFNKNNEHLYQTTDENGNEQHISGGDVLILNMHWALLHNPYRGLAQLQYNNAYGLTNAQKEFLYDYFIERNRHAEANALYDD